MKSRGYEINYLKSKRGQKTPDYIIDINNEKVVIEIGGKGKGREQFKGITVEKKFILFHKGEINDNKKPLFLIGYI
jgi:hypothetical protein